MSSEDIVKRKEKNEEKSRSKKEKNVEEEAADATTAPEEHATTEDVDQSDDGQKKRKRDHDELEIDVSLPEPPSKKALRKSKKAKTTTTSTATADDAGAESTEAQVKDENHEEKPEGKERRTPHSIWIGNLPWTASKQDLRDFLSTHGPISSAQITRLHMPAPSAAAAKDTRGRPAFKNRGFAYVDFDSAETLFTALQLTETPWYESGRNVLIKDAKSFEGRPEVSASDANGKTGKVEEKPASKRIFVGNLAFEITKNDLETHFGQCGPVDNIHVATFEDSGKCKGYAWVTFGTLEGAEAAVRGFVLKEPEDEEEGEEAAQDEEGEGKGAKQRKRKARKWFVNRLFGREVKREYAEDASVRYKKRFGSGAKREGNAEAGAGAGAGDDAPIREVNGDEDGGRSQQKHSSSHDRRREQRRAQKYGSERQVDARTIAPGAALAHAPRASGAIKSEGKKGTKVTFD